MVLVSVSLRDRVLLKLEMTETFRPSELFALRWNGFDMDRGTFTVTHTAYRGKLRDFGKTQKALRTVHLPEGLVNEWQWKQECPDHSPEAFVFPNARKRNGAKKNGFIRTDNYRARVLAKLAAELGLPKLNFQVLRRTMATLAQTKGGVKDVQGVLAVQLSTLAKGRVERNHGMHQDRLIKKMRRKGITSYAGANEYLEHEYLPAHNRRFARPPAKPEDYHGRKPTARELRQIFRLETERTISNDWVIRHESRYFQLQPRNRRYGPTKSKALVCEWEDGTMETYYRGKGMKFMEIPEPVRKPAPPVVPRARVAVVRKAKKDHPWRQGYQNMRPRIPNQVIATPPVGIRTYASP